MSKLLTPGHRRVAIQICAVTAVAALMSGCSADSTRFGDAFSNPFATGSIAKPKKVAKAHPSMGTGRTPPVVSSALPPSGGVTPVHSASLAPASSMVSHETTGSIPSGHAVAGASFGGWTGQGGASVQVSQGDTAAMLAQRYGVPENVLLQVNGLHSAAEVRPGVTIVVPIYNAVAGTAGGARVAQAAPVRVEPAPEVQHEAPQPVRTVPARAAKVEPLEEPVRKAPAVPFSVAKSQSIAERNAEAQRIVATQRAASAAADKAAAAQKLAEAKKAAEGKRLATIAERQTATQEAAKAKLDAAKAKQEAAKAKLEAQKAAALAAKSAKVAKVAAVSPAKPVQAAAVEAKKTVDATTTASLPPATASAAPAAATPAAPVVTADSGGPEFRWPARGRIIQGFKGGAGGNDGINIAVPEGTQVKAAEGGVVAYAGNELKGYGNLVLIKHPNGYVTAYANNGELDVKRGETVKRGQLIAKSGQSGNVSSPQLHFELRKGAQPVDPTGYLAGL